MRQIRLLPSGVQIWNKHVLGAGGGRFAYCSTLAVYVFDLDSFQLTKLLACHERTLSSISFSPTNPNTFVTSSIDQILSVWDLTTERAIKTLRIKSTPLQVEWSPQDSNLISVICSDSGGGSSSSRRSGTVFLWKLNSRGLKAIGIKDATVMRWNGSQGEAKLIAGHSDGRLSLYKVSEEASTRLVVDASLKGTPVEDIQWDPLSNNYVVISYSDGRMFLFDVEAAQCCLEFQRQTHKVVMIAWNPSIPGQFFTVNRKQPLVSIWNVSQKAPVGVHHSGGKSGFSAMKAVRNSNRFLLAFRDGSLGVFNVQGKNPRMEFTTQPGHSETIFDCRFKPSDRDRLATASYDGTVKLWNTQTMNCVMELVGQKGVLYAIAWAPKGSADEARLLSASSKGEIFMWDTRTGQKTRTFSHHSGSIYRLAWNPLDPNRIASTSHDSTCIIFNPNGKILATLTHPAQVYGCDWSPLDRGYLCTGCHDGIVRVFDTSSGSLSPKHLLKGHTMRSFNTVWSPLVRGMLASGSDDKTIRIWNISQPDSSQVLHGHTHNVRALVWSPEIPYLLFSGSWDSTIRMWDTRTGVNLHTIHDHNADVYGLVSHPDRPFVFVSSSRDTSLRFWTLDEHCSAQARLQVVISEGKALPSVRASSHEVMQAGASDSLPLRLCGPGSLRLDHQIKACSSTLERYRAMFSFFTSLPGLEDLWDLVEVCLEVKTASKDPQQTQLSRPDAQHLHCRNVQQVYRARALALVGSKGGFNRGKRADRIAQAAELHLKMGDLRQYCELMIQLDKWERALSVAPAVSLDYWRSLTDRYAQELQRSSDPLSIPYLAAGGQVDKIINFYLSINELSDANVVAVSDACKSFPAKHSVTGDTAESTPRPGGTIPVTPLLRDIVDKQAESYMSAAMPVRAACVHLSIGQHYNAVNCLIRGSLLELAFAVARLLNVKFVDHLYRQLAKRCCRFGLWDTGVSSLRRCRNHEREVSLLCSQYPSSHIESKNEFYIRSGIRRMSGFMVAAAGAQKMAEKTRFLIASGRIKEGLEAACGYLRDRFTGSSWCLDEDEVLPVIQAMQSVEVHDTYGEQLRDDVLAYSAYSGALRAIFKNYHPIVHFMFQTLRHILKRKGLPFPVPLDAIRLQEANYMARQDPALAQLIINEALGEQVGDEVRTALETLKANIGTGVFSDVSRSSRNSNLVIPQSCKLPSDTPDHAPIKSIVNHRPIQGTKFMLEDGKNCMSLGEALMWAKVNPYSPLNTGRHINPF